jgi:hypothetical protein
MTVSKSLCAAALAFGAVTLSQPASAYVLTFEGSICNGGGACGPFSPIDQSYGDVAGVVDVIYNRNVATFAYDGSLAARNEWWPDSYSTLTSVMYGQSGAQVGVWLKPAAGYSLTLNSFDLGSFPNFSRTSQVTIIDGTSNTTLFSSGNFLVPGDAPTVFSTPYTSAGGIKIQFGPDGYNVGIDNINFSVNQIGGAVPEPATWAMMLIGFAGLGFVSRRKAQIALANA